MVKDGVFYEFVSATYIHVFLCVCVLALHVNSFLTLGSQSKKSFLN